MSVIENIRNIEARLKKELQPKKSSSSNSFGSVEMAISDVPKITEKPGADWVFYGEDNLYPYKIGDLTYGSAIHNSIIKTKSKMTSGDGLLVNGSISSEDSNVVVSQLPADVQNAYEAFLENKPGRDPIKKVIRKISHDLQKFGAFSYEVIWNTDFTKISYIKHIKVQNVRAGKMIDGIVKSYWYCRDWKDTRKYKPIELPVLDQKNKTNCNQIVYDKIGDLDYYGEPSYIGGLTWIQTDFQMGIFHLSNIENGLNPSMSMKFYKLPATEDDKQKILDEIQKRYVGARKTGKHMVFFSDGKDLAPDVDPILTSNLDKQLLLLAELCDKKILTAHQATSPLLFGIAVAGQLGGNTELKTAFQIFDNVVIDGDRTIVSDSIQCILDINKITVKIKINPFDPFKEKVAAKSKSGVAEALDYLEPVVAAEVLKNMTPDEIRALAGLPKLPIPTQTLQS